MRADIAGAADDKNRFTCHAPPLLFTRDERNLDEIHVNKKKELRSASTDNTSNADPRSTGRDPPPVHLCRIRKKHELFA
jgi:hypothetical protein